MNENQHKFMKRLTFIVISAILSRHFSGNFALSDIQKEMKMKKVSYGINFDGTVRSSWLFNDELPETLDELREQMQQLVEKTCQMLLDGTVDKLVPSPLAYRDGLTGKYHVELVYGPHRIWVRNEIYLPEGRAIFDTVEQAEHSVFAGIGSLLGWGAFDDGLQELLNKLHDPDHVFCPNNYDEAA